MKKLQILIAAVAVSFAFSSFTPAFKASNVKTIALNNKQVTVFDCGYFVVAGQEYHAYADNSSGNVVALYETLNEGPDGTQLTVSGIYYSSPTHGLSVNVSWTGATAGFYNGPVYY